MNKKRFKKYLTKYQQGGCKKGFVWNGTECVEDPYFKAYDSYMNEDYMNQNLNEGLGENIPTELTAEDLPEFNNFQNLNNNTPDFRDNLDIENDIYKDSFIDEGINPNKEQGVTMPDYTYDLPSAATYLGQSIKDKNALGITTGGLKMITGLGRNVMSGMGLANRRLQAEDEMRDNQKNSSRGVNNIFYAEKGGQMKLPQELTGEYAGEQQMTPNAELEGGEYKQDNQGNVQEVVGPKHSGVPGKEGGVPMNLEEGEQILSDSTKIGKDLAKELRDNIDIKVKATSTYSDVMDKINKSIGLEKITKEQEEVIEKLSKVDSEDEDTRKVNETFLKNKINELEQKKQPLLQEKKMAFDMLFQKQEEAKIETEKANFFKEGGTMDTVNQMAKDFNLPLEDAKDVYYQEYKEGGKYLPKYQDGGVKDKLIELYKKTVGEDNAEYFKYTLEKEGLAGDIVEDLLTEKQTKDLLKGLGVKVPKGMDSKTMLKEVVNNVGYNWENFDSSEDKVKNYVDYKRGMSEDGYAKLPEEFTSMVDAPLDWVPPNRDKAVADKNFNDEILWDPMAGKNVIENIKPPQSAQQNSKTPQTKEGVATTQKNTVATTSPEDSTKKREFTDEFSDYNIGDNLSNPNLDGTTTPTFTQQDEADLKRNITFPTQFRLPPTGVQPHWMPNRTFDRVDPQQVSETPYFEQSNKMTDAQIRAIKDLPPAQRAAALMGISASQSDSDAKFAAEVGRTNAGFIQQADQVNAQTQRMEENARVQDALSFERRQLGALDNTQQSIKNYFDALSMDQLMKAQQSGQIDLLNDLYGDVDYTGSGVEQTSDGRDLFKNLSVEQRKALNVLLGKEDKKKKTAKAKYGGRFKKYKK